MIPFAYAFYIYWIFFYLSCNTTSTDAFANIIPLNPPTVNNNKNPIPNNVSTVLSTFPPYIVAIQLNTFIPVGIAIINVADVKYALESTSNPTVNI